MAEHAGIYVLAGTNGAGKSSVGGAAFGRHDGAYFNPDEATRAIAKANPQMRLAEANGLAWQVGYQMLQASIVNGSRYAFETTLGGQTITQTLIDAARRGIKIFMWYCALKSADLHVARVAARVKRGGHDIPVSKIRERYNESRRNLVRLLPHLEVLRVYDNSVESRTVPKPVLVLEMRQRKLVYADLKTTPEWAKPIVAAAYAIDAEARR